MYARASYSDDEFPRYAVSESEADFTSRDFYAGDPVCAQPRKGLGPVPYSTLFLLLATTVACAFASDAETRQAWTSKVERLASSLTAPDPPPPAIQNATAGAAQPATVPPPTQPWTAAAAQPLPEVKVTNAPGDQDGADDGKASEKKSVTEAYAPPRPSNDPYRRKAEAIGLNPDLSRVVLARLTPADYRNAAYAIDKAIKTVPDDGEFTWPRARKAGLAEFNVHFVEGAAHDCRRYVVTITKDRWTSTALPMEKCGVKVAFREGKEKSIEQKSIE
jgi:hypothetical protein